MQVVDDEFMVQVESYRLKLFAEHIQAQGLSCCIVFLPSSGPRLGGEPLGHRPEVATTLPVEAATNLADELNLVNQKIGRILHDAQVFKQELSY